MASRRHASLRAFAIALISLVAAQGSTVAAELSRSTEYAAVQGRLAQGWNTWDTHSVTAHVLLPEGFTLRVGLKHNTSLNADAFLADALIGRREAGAEEVLPGPHTWNGSYTELRLKWRGHEMLLQSAQQGEDLVLLATPVGPAQEIPPTLVISAGILWNRPGAVGRVRDHLAFRGESRTIGVYCTDPAEAVVTAPVSAPYFASTFTKAIGVSTGKERSLEEIRTIIERSRPSGTTMQGAIETVLGWDTIYEPTQARVISPVSRIWNLNWGGYVLFDWDTFFAASMAATINRDLAYANAIEILRESTPTGFVPNYARAHGWKSADRSEPPVGALAVLRLYRQFHDAWLLRDSFEPLLRWNRWWPQHRDRDGYLAWGSDPDATPKNPTDRSVGTKQGAMYESGLDNSPMFDDATYHPETHLLHLADVGLMSLYIADCNALAEIADILGKSGEAKELRKRSEKYGEKLQTLWDEQGGIYRNKNLDTGALSPRLSPTNLYPLLAKVPSPAQAGRMVQEHLLNAQEFGGDWMIPSIARSDAAFKDQEYWRGRIWGPMNYLVYLGLLNYDQPSARKELAGKSRALFEQEWKQQGHVHENYNAITGLGDDVSSSDRFYHWGALLALIDVMEHDEKPSGTARTQ
jgi:putative isomerase